jgi:oxygen-dependent protoporphyrinogen oxidase
MTSLVDALGARLPTGSVQLNASVTSLSRGSDNRWRLHFGSPTRAASSSTPAGAEGRPARDDPQSYDAVILALPAHAAAQLLNQLDAELADELTAIPYAGCTVVSFGFARRQIGHSLDGFGFVAPHCEGRRIIAASFASLKYPGRAPDKCVLIRAFVGGALQSDLLRLCDADLTRIAFDELCDLLTITGEPLVTDIARWPASMPQYHVGHLERVALIEQLAARWPNLALAGNAYRGVGIPQCIASGQSAAERLVSQIGSPPM